MTVWILYCSIRIPFEWCIGSKYPNFLLPLKEKCFQQTKSNWKCEFLVLAFHPDVAVILLFSSYLSVFLYSVDWEAMWGPWLKIWLCKFISPLLLLCCVLNFGQWPFLYFAKARKDEIDGISRQDASWSFVHLWEWRKTHSWWEEDQTEASMWSSFPRIIHILVG